jgi:hypothetical protein
MLVGARIILTTLIYSSASYFHPTSYLPPEVAEELVTTTVVSKRLSDRRWMI